jgi:hypothetical protein
MKQIVQGFASLQARRQLTERRNWEKMKNWGFAAHLAMNFAYSICSFAFVESILFLCFRLGWLRSPPPFSLAELLLMATILGGFSGVAYWFNMERKFDTFPPRGS